MLLKRKPLTKEGFNFVTGGEMILVKLSLRTDAWPDISFKGFGSVFSGLGFKNGLLSDIG